MLNVVAFDFGGVLAEEGFANGLRAIAARNGLEGEDFLETARELIYETGYVTGIADEHLWWEALRESTAVKGSDEELRQEILSRFVLRPAVLQEVRRLKRAGLKVVILSDQLDWLEELDRKLGFMDLFDAVFNSYRVGRSKREAALFDEVRARLNVEAQEILLVDDNPDNVARAASRGWKTLWYTGFDEFRQALGTFFAGEKG